MKPIDKWMARAIKNARATGMGRLSNEFRAVAVHEAAHAVIGHLIGARINLVSIMALNTPTANGMVNCDNPVGAEHNDNNARMGMAGVVAELLRRDGNTMFGNKFFGHGSGKNDFATVRKYVGNDMVHMSELAKSTLEMVERNYDVILNVADALGDKYVLNAEEFNLLVQ